MRSRCTPAHAGMRDESNCILGSVGGQYVGGCMFKKALNHGATGLRCCGDTTKKDEAEMEIFASLCALKTAFRA